jgi:hypothetical protein
LIFDGAVEKIEKIPLNQIIAVREGEGIVPKTFP